MYLDRRLLRELTPFGQYDGLSMITKIIFKPIVEAEKRAAAKITERSLAMRNVVAEGAASSDGIEQSRFLWVIPERPSVMPPACRNRE